LYLKSKPGVLLFFFWVTFLTHSFAQEPEQLADSISPAVDTIRPDTISPDSSVSSDIVIDAPVDYQSVDSMIFDVENQIVYLFGDAKVNYQDIELKAAYVELDMANDEIFAKGIIDSLGEETGSPVFREGGETFESKTLTYNFKTKRGIINNIITEQEGGYLHSKKTKKHENGEIHVQSGKYTTCDAEHPHFYISLSKAKVIPDDKIVSGPAYLVVEDVPLPIVMPFGFFPNQKGRSSGIIIPNYGEEKNRGFFFRQGGWYFALNDYFDLRILGDIFTNGTHGFNISSNYKKRYKFNGNVSIRYYKNVSGEKGLPTYKFTKDYSIRWTHQQDSKANPNSTFSASVNMSTSTYDQNHSYAASSYLRGQKSSSISFSKRWPNSPFNFSTSINHSQNNEKRSVNLNFPKANFNMSRQYPFKRRKRVGSTRWYENIEISYSSRLDNQVKTIDTLLFTSAVFDDMKSGFQHNIPISTQFRPFKDFSISPQLQYTGVLYMSHIKKHLDSTNAVVIDTIKGIKYAHAYLPSVSFMFNPKIYGIFQFKNPNFPVDAIRHVMTPSVSFSFIPDMSDYTPNYYRREPDDTTGKKMYSIFDDVGLYSTPTLRGRSGIVNFSLTNNLEMKVKSTKDTTQALKKVKILENLVFSTNYNVYADSLNWAPISMSARTRLFNKVNISFGGSFDPYAINENGNKINTFEFEKTGKLLRFTRFNFSVNFRLESKAGTGRTIQTSSPVRQVGSEGPQTLDDESMMFDDEYADFSVPWNLSIRYNYNYSKPGLEKNITQTFNFSGSITITRKWSIGFNSGWDFINKKLSYTSINFTRDLHCWQMAMSWIPLGRHQSYTFRINAKASILKDLKYEKQKSWYDRNY
jgi:hypothetical protein